MTNNNNAKYTNNRYLIEYKKYYTKYDIWYRTGKLRFVLLRTSQFFNSISTQKDIFQDSNTVQ